MDSRALRERQAPLKSSYADDPDAATITLSAEYGDGECVSCPVSTGRGHAAVGLHPATGGAGLSLSSGDMLLEALVACAGVTLNAVSTAMGIEIRDATVRAVGDIDFRGTLGVAKDAPVGFTDIRLTFEFASDASQEQLDKLMRQTERYCVVAQTLSQSPNLTVQRQEA